MVVAAFARMSAARPIFKGVSLMLTRRVRGRTLLLRPSKRTNQIVGYVVAVMVKRWNIKLHAMRVMGNHWHLVVTDPDGNIVDFQRDCHHFVARGLNVHYGDVESVWSSDQSSRVECEQPEDIINKIAYTMANPVEAALVRFGSSWPGLGMVWPRRAKTFKRPPKYFRGPEKGGDWPDEVVLELSRPPGYEELCDEELAAVIKASIDEREATFRAKYDAEGRQFLGRRAVLAQSRHAVPRSRESRSRISPKVACRDKWRRVERLLANRQWLAGYRAALARWRAGERDVVFPPGTYKMRVVHGVICAPAT